MKIFGYVDDQKSDKGPRNGIGSDSATSLCKERYFHLNILQLSQNDSF